MFRLTGSAERTISGYSEKDPRPFRVAYWVHEQTRIGNVPTVVADTLETIGQLPAPTMQRRLHNVLRIVVELTNNMIGGTLPVQHPRLRVGGFCRDPGEIWWIHRYWHEKNVLVPGGENNAWTFLTVDGLIEYEKIFGGPTMQSQAFVAMWFNEEVHSAYYEGICPAITSAGYDSVRVDQVNHNGKIDDQIIAEIRRSRFVVADFTKHRPGVYYEAGFAHGLGLDVIFTFMKNQLKKLHFDVRQYSTIVWDNPEQLRRLLQNRILATLGAGPNAPNAAPLPEEAP